MQNQNRTALLISIAIALGIGAVGSFFTTPEIPAWYATLNKPSFNPPNWVFAPVWTTLYVMMAVAAWLVWRTHKPETHYALTVYGVQLALNFFWSILFFRLHSPGLALIDILAMWLAIATTIALFWPIDWRAGALLVPYLAWVSYATALNAAIWVLN